MSRSLRSSQISHNSRFAESGPRRRDTPMEARGNVNSLRLFALAAPLGLIVGCASDAAPVGKPVHPVRGQLFVKKAPAVGAELIFVPVDEPDEPTDPRPRAVVGEDGSFALSTHGDGDGAPAGEYVVVVTWPGKVLPDGREEPPDKLFGRYADPRRSRLRATVKEGTNELEPFQL